MQYRSLGKSNLEVSAIGLGCMSLSGVYGAAEDAASEDLIRHTVDQGINHLDSADMYGWGQNEEVVGRAIKGRRDRVVLATKFGQTRRDGQPNGVNGRPAYVAQACDASLKRLGVDVIDLYYQHRVDPDVPIEDTVGAMSRLVEKATGDPEMLCDDHTCRRLGDVLIAIDGKDMQTFIANNDSEWKLLAEVMEKLLLNPVTGTSHDFRRACPQAPSA